MLATYDLILEPQNPFARASAGPGGLQNVPYVTVE